MKRLAILACFVLVACAPSGPTESEIATQVAEGTIATLTASAPTPAPTLTSTPMPTPTRIPPPVRTAEVIYRNGVILTMEPEYLEAQAIAIHGEKIVAVGTDQEIMALHGPGTQVIDLQGRMLMPGFVDAHTHIFDRAETHLGLSLEEAQQLALENGITTLADMFVTPESMEQMQAFAREVGLRVRTSLYLIYNTACGDVLGDWYEEHPPTPQPGEMLRIVGVKLFTDGGSCNAPAVSFEYPSGVGHGDLYFTQEELDQIVAEVQAADYQLAIHALGDRAIEQAQNAIAAALEGAPNTYRHRIEHNAVLRPDLIPRYGDSDIVAVIFGTFPTCFMVASSGEFKYATPPEYQSWEWPWRELMNANPGLHIAWHTDFPVFTIDPIQHLHGFVTRKQVAEDGVTVCEPPDWAVDDTITAAEALPMMTIESAYALFREEEVGSLKPGKYADLIILSGNPQTGEPDGIKDIHVLMTMVGGQVEYCDSGHAGLCPGAYRARIKITTTSDWTTFGLVNGASWLRPSLVSASGEATYAWLEGNRFLLTQPLARAEAEGRVEMVVDVFLVDLDPEGMLVFEIERGHLGSTEVELSNYLGSEPLVIEAFWWDGINPDERNTLTVQTPAGGLLD